MARSVLALSAACFAYLIVRGVGLLFGADPDLGEASVIIIAFGFGQIAYHTVKGEPL
jgi:hypothetical protein